MAETPEPGALDDPFAPNALLEQRLRVLESAWTQPRPGQPVADPRTADHLSRLESLAEELAAYKTQMRDQEKALVERIADVDDDRRLASAQLQRGWQAQRDEFDARLRRHGGRTALALGLSLALVGGALFALYSHVKGTQAAQAKQIESLSQDLRRFSGAEHQNALMQEKLASLSAVVAQMSTTVGEITGGQHQTPRPQGTETSPLAGEIARLAAGEQHLTEGLESLKHALESLLTGMPLPSGPADATALARRQTTPDDNIGKPPPTVPADTITAATPDRLPPTQAATEATTTVGVGLAAPQTAAAPVVSPLANPSAGEQSQTVTVTDRPFALQLFGSYNRAKVLEQAARADLPGQVYLREETRRGRPWFVLIHSLHGSKEEARIALDQLPQTLRTPTPWVRTLSAGVSLDVIRPEHLP